MLSLSLSLSLVSLPPTVQQNLSQSLSPFFLSLPLAHNTHTHTHTHTRARVQSALRPHSELVSS